MTLINIPKNKPYLTIGQQNQCKPIIESIAQQYNSSGYQCICANGVVIHDILSIVQYNLIRYLDDLKRHRPLLIPTFADRVFLKLLDSGLITECGLCNFKKSVIQKFLNHSLQRILSDQATPTVSDYSSLGAYKQPSLGHLKRPNQRAIESFTQASPLRRPFSDLTNVTKTYSRCNNKQ